MTAPNGESLFLYLTTRGRRSGSPREIEIWFTERDGHYFVIAEHGHRTNWVQNILVHPTVSFRVGDKAFSARARVVDPERDAQLNHAVQKLSEGKYGWGDGLVVELTPD